MARHDNKSDALFHALRFEAAKSATYINESTSSRCSQKDPIPQYRHGGRHKETIQEQQCKKSAVPQRSFETKNKDRRPKCYNCGKRGHLQVDCWEKKIPREESDRINWRSKAPEQHTVSTLHKTLSLIHI